jgi:purine nucleosidase
MKRKIIIDTDPGQDDAVAILLALASPDELDVLAIVAVAGNIGLAQNAENALKVVELSGRTDVPVYAGSVRPMRRQLVTAEHVHGATGLDGPDLPKPKLALQSQHGVDFLVDTLRAAEPASITLGTLGPLTNVAMALVKAPEIVHGIREIVMMGGAYFEVGNITPTAEFNIFVDPEAAAIVFGSGLPLTMIGLNLTHQARATREVLERIRAQPGVRARAVEGWMAFFGAAYERTHGEFAPPVHDPCTVAMLIDTTLIRSTDAFVAVETEGRWTRGATVVDLTGRLGRPANARVALELDAPRFWDLVIAALAP